MEFIKVKLMGIRFTWNRLTGCSAKCRLLKVANSGSRRSSFKTKWAHCFECWGTKGNANVHVLFKSEHLRALVYIMNCEYVLSDRNRSAVWRRLL